VRLFLGPQEESWYRGGPLAAAATAAGAEVVRGLPLPEVAARLAGCAALVTNDSGLLHLAEAVGTPVVALFGPTVRAFGYAPHLPASRLLETDLDCRPCSRNGKRPCRRGDLACLERLDPAVVLAATAPLLRRDDGKDAP
jgi:ADP-heptose:LPS heptosyltransferase